MYFTANVRIRGTKNKWLQSTKAKLVQPKRTLFLQLRLTKRHPAVLVASTGSKFINITAGEA